MKKLVLIITFTCACISIQAQVNRVRNASFEHYKKCPVVLDQIQFANYWNTTDTVNILVVPSSGDSFSVSSCAPEYINACAGSNFDVGVPNTVWFHQYPRTGNGMTQVVMYTDDSNPLPNKRDYLLGRLYNNLIAGTTYCVTFYVSFNGINNAFPCSYAVDHIGAYLDDGTICHDTGANYCGLPKPWITPQVYTTSIITDTINWTKIQGSFTANGIERFITIGNFFDNAHTNNIRYASSGFGLYLVDDVSVIESTEVAHAGPDVGVVAGDSVHIGTNEEGMPCTWYEGEGATPIGYGGGIWVKPTVTTTYVVEMDLCGNVTRDSVKVTVWPVGVPFGKHTMTERDVLLYPNPAGDEVTVGGASSGVLMMTDAVGRVVVSATMSSNKEVVNISHLPGGIYIVQIADPVTGAKVVKRVVKE